MEERHIQQASMLHIELDIGALLRTKIIEKVVPAGWEHGASWKHRYSRCSLWLQVEIKEHLGSIVIQDVLYGG